MVFVSSLGYTFFILISRSHRQLSLTLHHFGLLNDESLDHQTRHTTCQELKLNLYLLPVH